MRKKIMLLLVVLLVSIPIAVFAIPSNGYMGEAEALAERVQWEERNRTQDVYDVVMPSSEQVQVDFATCIDTEEALLAREERIQLEECNYDEIEPHNLLCIFGHSWRQWSTWYGWPEGNNTFHHNSCIRITGIDRGVLCRQYQSRHRTCLRDGCDAMDTDYRTVTFRCT